MRIQNNKKKIITCIFCPAPLSPSFPEAGERKKTQHVCFNMFTKNRTY